MTKPRVVIVGAGLCGSVLAARLRNAFEVVVVEQSPSPKPLLDDIACSTGGITDTINRGAGLGGTTNYWHNALIELAPDELVSCGIDPVAFAPWYAQAWATFLSPPRLAACRQIRAANAAGVIGGGTAHMVVPQSRANMWELANRTWPGDPVTVRYARATGVETDGGGHARGLRLDDDSSSSLAADHFILSAGGLSTPQLLATSFRAGDTLCGGYHDHPMAYVGKVRLRPDSMLKRVSCVDTGPTSVREGFVYEAQGLKAVFYLRPALNLRTASITGDARYVLSDLRNDPFSPRKILALLRNVEALREAVLFKSRAGYRGDFYSLLMLGEQAPMEARGLRCRPGERASLDWHVTPAEHAAYQDCLTQFLAEAGADVVDRNIINSDAWDYRTAAHHSGTARDFLAPADNVARDAYSVNGVSGLSVCDGSMLLRGGVANSGLTLIALALQLADSLIEQFGQVA